MFLHAENEDRSDCADVQAILSLRLERMLEKAFAHVAAQLMSNARKRSYAIYR